MAHTAEELAAFQSGEVRMIYGRVRASGGLFLLEHGDAVARRARVKEHLQCVIPGCPTPKLTTVSRPRFRDGFRHLVAANHPGMSELHAQAQLRLRDWLRSQSDADVQLEMATASKDRRADVMISAGGKQAAFEIQYSALDQESFLQRTRSYLDQSIR